MLDSLHILKLQQLSHKLKIHMVFIINQNRWNNHKNKNMLNNLHILKLLKRYHKLLNLHNLIFIINQNRWNNHNINKIFHNINKILHSKIMLKT